MMDLIHGYLWRDGHFRWWEIVGGIGSAIFFSRFFVQWYATERKKRVVIPMSFWWLSLAGSLALLAYAAFGQRSFIFTLAYLFAWIPYVRNIVIHRRHEDEELTCSSCGAVCPPKSNYCYSCGNALAQSTRKAPASKH